MQRKTFLIKILPKLVSFLVEQCNFNQRIMKEEYEIPKCDRCVCVCLHYTSNIERHFNPNIQIYIDNKSQWQPAINLTGRSFMLCYV